MSKNSSQTPFDLFIDLINFDQALQAQKREIQKIVTEVEKLELEKSNVQEALVIAKNLVHDAKKNVDEKELEMKELEQKEARTKERMNSVTNQKEYQSAKHELEIVVAQQLALEEVLVAAWNELESAQKKYEAQELDRKRALQDIDTKITELEQEAAKKRKLFDEKKSAREEKESLVPGEWLEKYNIMKAQVPDPVVPVQDGSCTSCFHYLTGQEIIMLNRNKLLQCKGCYRFLYNESMAKSE